MKLPNVSITTTTRKRRLTHGDLATYKQWYVNYCDPLSGRRVRRAFDTKKAAEASRDGLLRQFVDGSYADPRSAPTVAEAVAHWLADREGKVKASTHASYAAICKAIVGPLLEGTTRERTDYAKTGVAPKGAKFEPLLGLVRLTDLTTAHIRVWHRIVTDQCGAYTANRAKAHLQSALALAEEDFRIRAPAMPSGLVRQRAKVKKAILSPEQIRALLAEAQTDPEGMFYAFPFLAGTRPSEQLGLLWSEVDFDRNVITICRVQERDGSLTEMTKTEAGTREVPMSAMLLEWRVRCPRRGKELHRVFPGPGRLQPWPKPRIGGGGPLASQNFRRRYWEPVFERLGLPYVTPHSARHAFISTLQAEGIEVGLVAKLAGHASPAVTLSHYTQAVRGGEAAVAALDRAFAQAGTGS